MTAPDPDKNLKACAGHGLRAPCALGIELAPIQFLVFDFLDSNFRLGDCFLLNEGNRGCALGGGVGRRCARRGRRCADRLAGGMFQHGHEDGHNRR